MKKPFTPFILPHPKPPTTVIVAAVIGTVVLSNLTVPTNGQIRRLRTHRLSYHGHGFGRSIAARDVRSERDPSRRRRKREVDVRRRDRASVEDLGSDRNEQEKQQQQQQKWKPRRKEREKTQRRNLQPLFVDDDGVAMDGDFVDDNRYEYEYDFDYVLPEGTLPDDAIGMFDDNLATPSIFEENTDVPDLPPGFPIVSIPPLDFSFSFPDNENVPFLDGNGNGNSEEDYPAEIAESGLFSPGLDEDNEEVSTMPSPANDSTQDSFFETTAIDAEEDAFLGIPSLSMSFGMPDSHDVFDDHYSMSMSMPWTFEPSITPPATEPPSSPSPPSPSASPTGLPPTRSPSDHPSHPPSLLPSLLPTSEIPTPFMGLSMDYDMSMSMDYEMSVGAASGSDDGYETNETGMSMDYDDGGSMSMSMDMSMSIPMPTKPPTSQTTPSPTLIVQDLPYIPTNGNTNESDEGNEGLIPAEESTSTNAPTFTVGGGAVGDGETREPSFFPTTAFPTEESFGRAVPATGPSSPSSSSFGITSFGMRFVWVLIGIEGLRMMLVV